ncbi:MAG: LysR family transcriptional regulator [Rhodovulum sulfidophilum]|uniref:LysR family transcriptional regulator n=1 Tax=Rhodovulum sulfidophilum TaxID=35806 RepID=A0A2W5NA62_RHOSU|nr:MAG: LysR family transcriptional regulator [Rhodovulum sulfidophilum]
MTLEQLRIFLEVARRAHVTRAAESLNMTQSAVSAAIRALERRYGVDLFDRVGRSIRLNQAGRAFLPEAQRLMAQAAEAEAALRDLGEGLGGTLAIMASQTVGAYWLPPRLARFRAAHPGIGLDVRIGNTEAAEEAVARGEVEIAIVEGAPGNPALSARVVASDEMIFVGPPDHPGRPGGVVDRDALRAARWVLREPGSGTRRAFEALAARHGLSLADLDVALTMPGNEAVLGAVEAGLGETFISRSAASLALRGGLLRETGGAPDTRPFYLLRHSEARASRVAAAFEALLDQEI